ncbi:MAG: hypothetical protein IJR85_06560 [Synergistaceae bacterium]|nr:hypothetical protein [Synergistaceae bacterium]
MAAIEVWLKKITCLAIGDELTQDQKTAIQLSQKAISSQDDKDGAKSANMFWLAKLSQYDDWLDTQEDTGLCC